MSWQPPLYRIIE